MKSGDVELFGDLKEHEDLPNKWQYALGKYNGEKTILYWHPKRKKRGDKGKKIVSRVTDAIFENSEMNDKDETEKEKERKRFIEFHEKLNPNKKTIN